VGRIEYVKFTSVIFDYNIYLFYLLKQRTNQVKQKNPTKDNPTKIKPQKLSKALASSADRTFIFLNFVFKIQIQYFIESECDINTRSCRVIKKIQRKRSIRTWVAGLARGSLHLEPFLTNRNPIHSPYYSIFDLCSTFKLF